MSVKGKRRTVGLRKKGRKDGMIKGRKDGRIKGRKDGGSKDGGM